MSDPIHIPCASCSDGTGVHIHTLITPDIARQIVQMGDTEHSHPATSEAIVRLEGVAYTLKANIDGLIGSVAAMLMRMQTLESKMNDVLPNLTPAPVAADKPAPAYDGSAVRQMLDDERAKMQATMCGFPPNDAKTLVNADQPAGDDAAVEALEEAILSCDGATAEEACQDAAHEYAAAALAAIRRGEVPLPADVVVKIANDYNNGLACCSGRDCGCGGYSRLQEAVGMEVMHRTDQQDKEIADLRAKLAEAQQGRIAELEQMAEINRQSSLGMRAERDKALADLAAEQTAHVNTGARCAALGHTLDAMTERAEAEMKHANEWARKAHEARAEADALRAAAVALTDSWYHEAHRLSNSCDGHRGTYEPDVLRRCASALLRAAGVEVEG